MGGSVLSPHPLLFSNPRPCLEGEQGVSVKRIFSLLFSRKE